jgi:hypothetical protein
MILIGGAIAVVISAVVGVIGLRVDMIRSCGADEMVSTRANHHAPRSYAICDNHVTKS